MSLHKICFFFLGVNILLLLAILYILLTTHIQVQDISERLESAEGIQYVYKED